MKKLYNLLLCLFVCVGLIGCSDGDAKDDSNTVSNPFANSEKSSDDDKKSASPDSSQIQIEDLDWEVKEGVYEGERKLLFSYTNNSKYDILNFKIKFSLKSNLTDEDIRLFKEFTHGSENTPLTDEELKTLYIDAPGLSNILVETGSSLNSKPCRIYGKYGLNWPEKITLDHYNHMEPDMASLQYIANNKLYLVFYDFKNKNYTQDKVIDAYEWSDSTLSNMLPKAEMKIGEIVKDTETEYKFKGYGIDEAYFHNYISECKNRGFTNISKESSVRYTATNNDGYEVSVSYYDSNDEFIVAINKPE